MRALFSQHWQINVRNKVGNTLASLFRVKLICILRVEASILAVARYTFRIAGNSHTANFGLGRHEFS